jgi:hypothetical protein
MSKLISISIDVTKIPRDKIITGAKGKYVSMDIWINDEPDQWGKDCSVNISQSKEEREAKQPKVYCGNGKKLFGFTSNKKSPHDNNSNNSQKFEEDDEIAF